MKPFRRSPLLFRSRVKEKIPTGIINSQIGVGVEGPIEVAATDLVFGLRSIEGSLTGSTVDCEQTLAFTALRGLTPIIETMALDEAPVAFAKMMSGRANMRLVLVRSKLTPIE